MLSACSEPQLAPLPPAVRTVTVYKPLDKSLTMPCDDPMWSPDDIQTDVDLMGLYRQQKATSDCNAGKLRAIDKLQAND